MKFTPNSPQLVLSSLATVPTSQGSHSPKPSVLLTVLPGHVLQMFMLVSLYSPAGHASEIDLGSIKYFTHIVIEKIASICCNLL